jgi:uncharacterized protein HemX
MSTKSVTDNTSNYSITNMNITNIPSSTPPVPVSDDNNNTTVIYIVVFFILAIGLGLGIYFYTKSKNTLKGPEFVNTGE